MFDEKFFNSPQFQAYFHKTQMKRLRSEVPQVVHATHVLQKDKHFIEVRVKNDQGGKDTITYPLYLHPSKMTTEGYDFIIKNLKERDYEANV